MEQAPALPSIIAKTLVLLDSALDIFATAQVCQSSDACGLPVYRVEITNCGQAMIDNLSALLYGIVALFNQLLSSAGAYHA